jgi:hypothetical protein
MARLPFLVKHENEGLRLSRRLRPSSLHNVPHSVTDHLIFKNFPMIETSPASVLLFELLLLRLSIINDPLFSGEACLSLDLLCHLFPLIDNLIFMGVINQQHFFSWDKLNLSSFNILLLMTGV